jgi:hypothetical protein
MSKVFLPRKSASGSPADISWHEAFMNNQTKPSAKIRRDYPVAIWIISEPKKTANFWIADELDSDILFSFGSETPESDSGENVIAKKKGKRS